MLLDRYLSTWELCSWFVWEDNSRLMPTLSNNLFYLFRGPFKMDSLKTLGIQNGPNPYQQFTNHDCLRSDKPTLSCRKETLRRFSPVCSDIFRFDRHTPTYCQHVIQIVSGMPHAVLWYAVRILRLVYPIYKAHEINEADHGGGGGPPSRCLKTYI